jgi:hypothetical protein
MALLIAVTPEQVCQCRVLLGLDLVLIQWLPSGTREVFALEQELGKPGFNWIGRDVHTILSSRLLEHRHIRVID